MLSFKQWSILNEAKVKVDKKLMDKFIKKAKEKHGEIVPIFNEKSFADCFRREPAFNELQFWFTTKKGKTSTYITKDQL